MTDPDAQPVHPFVHSGAPQPSRVTHRTIVNSEPALPDLEHKVAAVVGLAGAREALHKAKGKP